MNVALLLVLVAQLIGTAAVWLEDHLVASGRRTGTLYCRVGIGFHLQIHPNGRVNGSHEPSNLSKYLIVDFNAFTRLWKARAVQYIMRQ